MSIEPIRQPPESPPVEAEAGAVRETPSYDYTPLRGSRALDLVQQAALDVAVSFFPGMKPPFPPVHYLLSLSKNPLSSFDVTRSRTTPRRKTTTGLARDSMSHIFLVCPTPRAKGDSTPPLTYHGVVEGRKHFGEKEKREPSRPPHRSTTFWKKEGWVHGVTSASDCRYPTTNPFHPA
ncbi:hypothetical protein VTK73DRAFT_4009 [Phialemonium thermophilum]|uniref:Uncharacterized protein n=1 Tax=Phialemonium thermophilum TaxID=223376 RepID=A0ABR3WWE2_9PEZI